MTKNKVEVVPLGNLQPDPNNANKGTERGLRVLDDSLRDLGAGRSVLADKHGVLIAGNKTLERAVDQGFKEAVVVHTNGHQLVVVQRDDLDLSKGGKAQRMAIVDNRSSELGLDWDAQILADLQAQTPEMLAGLFNDQEIAELLESIQKVSLEPELDESLAEGVSICICSNCGHEHHKISK